MMKTIDEQMQVVLKRAERFRILGKLRKMIFGEALAVILLMIAGIRSAVAIPIAVSEKTSGIAGENYGSLLIHDERMGLVIVAVCAFLAGICLTLLCIHAVTYWREDHNG